MPNQTLIDWIREYRKAGYTSQQLSDYLIKQGYNLELINESLKYASIIENSESQNNSTKNVSQFSSQPGFLNEEEQKVNPKNSIYAKNNSANIKNMNNDFNNFNNLEYDAIKSKKQKRKIAILIVISFVIILVIGGYFLYKNNSFNTDPMPIYFNNSDNYLNDSSNSNLQNEESENQYISEQELIICETKECFADKFARCEKASINVDLLSELVYHYEIIEPENGYCKVRSFYLQNPDVAWLNKEMICLYDVSLQFDDSIKDVSRCTGSLADLFNAGLEITV